MEFSGLLPVPNKFYIKNDATVCEISVASHQRRTRPYQGRNRKRHRRKHQQFRHRKSGCAGTCRNMFSCMFSGHKVDWDNHESCPGMMDTCCTSWGPPRHKKYTKSGRSLGPFSPQVQVIFPN